MSIRTTLTLDDDVSARLREEAKKRGLSFKEIVNDAVRAGLRAMNSAPPPTPFTIETFDMGWIPGLNYDDVSGLLDLIEGEDRR